MIDTTELQGLQGIESRPEGVMIPSLEIPPLVDDSELPPLMRLGHRMLMHSILNDEPIGKDPVPHVSEEEWLKLGAASLYGHRAAEA